MKKHSILRRFGVVLIILGLLCAVALVGFELLVRPSLKRLLEYKCGMYAERVISSAVFERFGEEDVSDVIRFTYDKDGRIAALSTDRAKINSVSALLTEAVNDGIERLGSENVGISLGTFTGISFLYGTELCFRIEPKGRAETRLKCSFDSAGINQTIHSIILEVDAHLSPMIPLYSETVDVSCDLILAQTVIVGSVPESYSYIVLDQEHLSDIADIDIT